MRKAIIVDYLIDQNEPSKPFSQVFILPDDKEERDKALRKLWRLTFLGTDEDIQREGLEMEDGDIPILEEDDTRFGDITVGEDPLLFITFLDEETPEVTLSCD